MNRLKLLYDVVKTMKDKEEVKGSLQVNGEKNQVQIFSFGNEFARNLQSGATKAKISTQVDYDGNKVKHESYTEFNVQDGSHQPMFPGFKGHMHHHRHGHGHKPGDLTPRGFKDKLNRITFVLSMLNQITITEQDDKSVLLGFAASEIPAEMKQVLQEKMLQHQNAQAEHQHPFMHEFADAANSSFEASVRINRNHEVEKVLLAIAGKRAAAPETGLSLKAELNLVW